MKTKEELLKKEINEDRECHGKKPLKEKEDDNDDDTLSKTQILNI